MRQRLAGAHLGARFEFSMMPADGGFIVPHTDATTKLVNRYMGFDSWHAVHPMRGAGSPAMRKTLTVVIVQGE